MVESTAACLVLQNDSGKNSNPRKHTSLFPKGCGKLKSAKHFRVKLLNFACVFSSVF